MQYRGYIGIVEWDEDAGIFHGRVGGIRDVITFEGETQEGLQAELAASVDDYLEACAEDGKSPEQPEV